MRNPARAPALVLLTLLAAGCIDAGNEPVAPGATVSPPESTLLPAPEGSLDKNASVPAPTWSVGDAWHGTVVFGDESRPITFAVTGADASGYTMGTSDNDTAVYDAVFDVSYVGRIRASDLAGHQQGQPVAFFSFPLSDGKTWTAQWDGLQVNLTATFNPAIKTKLGLSPGFDVAATVGGQPFATFDYVPALRWWSHLTFAEGYGFTLDSAQANWTGSVVASTAKVLLDVKSPTPVLEPGAHAFTVSQAQHAVVVVVQAASGAHFRAFNLMDPDNKPYATTMPSGVIGTGGPPGYFHVETLPPTPGQWKAFTPAVHGPEGVVRLLVQEVAVAQKAVP